MFDNRSRHGCLTLAVLAASLAAATVVRAAPSDDEVSQVRSHSFEIAYQVNEDAQPLSSVYLYFTDDEGQSWTLAGTDRDRQSPITFDAPCEGLFGFYFVVANDAGTSSPPPGSDTEPQQWAFVDYTPPIVQLHPLRLDADRPGEPVVQVRWTAIDDHLYARPIGLAYRHLPEGRWTVFARHVANTGRYDWRVPATVNGTVAVHITVRDRGGNTVSASAAAIHVPPPGAPVSPTSVDGPEAGAGPAPPRSAEQRRERERKRQRAQRLYEQGVWHMARGEQRLALARLRDALRLQPDMTMALVDLGKVVYALGDYDEAADAFHLSLQQEPRLRSALEGLARVAIAQRQYPQAADYLGRILEQRADDVETWLNLGDVAIYQGDEAAAREYYRRAAVQDPRAHEVIRRAQLRLDNLADLRQRYEQKPDRP